MVPATLFLVFRKCFCIFRAYCGCKFFCSLIRIFSEMFPAAGKIGFQYYKIHSVACWHSKEFTVHLIGSSLGWLRLNVTTMDRTCQLANIVVLQQAANCDSAQKSIFIIVDDLNLSSFFTNLSILVFFIFKSSVSQSFPSQKTQYTSIFPKA